MAPASRLLPATILASIVPALLLGGCAATGPRFSSPESTPANDPQVVVYRISQVGGKAGTWMPTRLEVDANVVGRLPDASFITFSVPAGEIALSATAMVDFRYADGERLTLQDRVGKGDVAYFRIESVFGTDCALVSEKVEGTPTAHRTYYPRPDWPQTLCFQRVPAAVASRALVDLRRAD
jgi:hypothetical protein